MFGRLDLTLGALPLSSGLTSLPTTSRGLEADTSRLAGVCSPDSSVLHLDPVNVPTGDEVSGVFAGTKGVPRNLVRGLGVGLGVNGEPSSLPWKCVAKDMLAESRRPDARGPSDTDRLPSSHLSLTSSCSLSFRSSARSCSLTSVN